MEADEIKTTKPHKAVDDSGNPAHVSKDKGHKVKAEDTDQQPVERTNDNKGKCSAVQVFISHSYLTFCTVSGTGCNSFCKFPLFIQFYLKKRSTPYTFPRIWQFSTIIGAMVSFSGCRRIWPFSL